MDGEQNNEARRKLGASAALPSAAHSIAAEKGTNRARFTFYLLQLLPKAIHHLICHSE